MSGSVKPCDPRPDLLFDRNGLSARSRIRLAHYVRQTSPFQVTKRGTNRGELRRDSWLRRRLRAEDAFEAFAVLQEDQYPQNGGY